MTGLQVSERIQQPIADVETHIVTISIGYGNHGEVHEVFRGSEEECLHLASRITCCSNDLNMIHGVAITCGLISDWESHVYCMLQRGVAREGPCDEQD